MLGKCPTKNVDARTASENEKAKENLVFCGNPQGNRNMTGHTVGARTSENSRKSRPYLRAIGPYPTRISLKVMSGSVPGSIRSGALSGNGRIPPLWLKHIPISPAMILKQGSHFSIIIEQTITNF